MLNFEKNKGQFLLVWAAVVLVLSVLATFGSLYFLSATPTGEAIRVRLGLDNLKTFNIQTSTTERIVIEESSAIIDATKRISPAVVSINGKGAPIQSFFGPQTPDRSGTGFVITSDGLIATNRHVVGDLVSFTVTTSDGRSYDGEVVAKDPVTDLALVKVDARGLQVAQLGDSSRLEVGQWVIAIGNALGELQNTVTVGVVSALERSASPTGAGGAVTQLDGLIQTDAAINPGNSGGPLVDLRGQVIGINTAIAGGIAQNIGFAIQVNDLKQALDSYRSQGAIVRPYIGVRYQTLTKAIATSLDLPTEQGALLVGTQSSPAVIPGSPAATAGLRSGDIITQIDGRNLTDSSPLARVIRVQQPGDKITITFLRDGETRTTQLTLGELRGD